MVDGFNYRGEMFFQRGRILGPREARVDQIVEALPVRPRLLRAFLADGDVF